MALSTRPTAWMVDADLGELRLESLERPLLPVATDLRQLCPVVLTRGPLGFAVRASASAPGVFAPTRDGEVRYADGAVSDNAPFRPLEIAGADLVVVCNTLPAQRIRDRDGGLADRLSPLRRMGQLQQAFSLLLHRAGTPEANPNRVTYAAAPDPSPLEQTFRYGDAERYLDRARQDPRLAEAVSAVHAAWQVPRLNPALESRP